MSPHVGRNKLLGCLAVLGAAISVTLYHPDKKTEQTQLCKPFPQSHEVESYSETMVWIEAGSFMKGSDSSYLEERPAHLVSVEGFWIDQHEVTNAEFRAFINSTGYVTTAEKAPNLESYLNVDYIYSLAGAAVFSPAQSVVTGGWEYVPGANWRYPEGPKSSIENKDNYPVVQISYEDAAAYAKWIGKELPTEDQWEYAASQQEDLQSRVSNMEQPKNANTWQGFFPLSNSAEDGFEGLAPVGCYEPSQKGLYDMIGNAWEWTSDRYAYANQSTTVGQRILKGGSFLCSPNFCQRYRPEAIQAQDENFSTNHIGFRLVLNNQPPKQN